MQPTQPLVQVETVTSDANGAVTFTFPSPAPGETWTGTVSVPVACASAHFTATVPSGIGATWSGTTAGGPVQIVSGQLSVTATGCTPNQSHSCILAGRSEDSGTADPPQPAQTGSVSTWTQTFVVASGSNAGIPFTMRIDPAWRAIRLFVPSGSSGVQVEGLTTNVNYVTGAVMAADTYLDVPVDGAADSRVAVAISSGSGPYWVTALTSDAIVQVTTPSDQPLPVTGSVGISSPLDGAGFVLVDPQPGGATTGKSGVETLTSGGHQQAFTATFVPKYGVSLKYVSNLGTGFATVGFSSGVTLTQQLANREPLYFPLTVVLSGLHWISTNTGDTLEWFAV